MKPRPTFTRRGLFSAIHSVWWLTLVSFLISGAYKSFILPAFSFFLWGAAAMLALFIVAGFSKMGVAEVRPEDLVRGGILLVPVAALWLANGSSLDSYAYYKRSLAGGRPGVTSESLPSLRRSAPTDKSPEQGHRFSEPARKPGEEPRHTSILGLLRRPEEFDGKLVELDGMATRPDYVARNEFILFRFTIVCCVADSRPLGVRVQHPEAKQVEDSGWYTVIGRFHRGKNGEGIITETTVKELEAPPDQPYLY